MQALSNTAEQKKCSSGVADESKCRDPTTMFRTGETNILQAQRWLLLSAPACLQRYQAKYCSEIMSPTLLPEGGNQLHNCLRWETRRACRWQLQPQYIKLPTWPPERPAAPFHVPCSLQAPAEAPAASPLQRWVWRGKPGPQAALGCTSCCKHMNGSSLPDRGLLSYSPVKSPH